MDKSGKMQGYGCKMQNKSFMKADGGFRQELKTDNREILYNIH
jgi:hypothetical protein